MLLPLPSKPNTCVIYLKGSIKMCQTSFWDAATQIRFLPFVLFMSICVAFKVFMIRLQISLSRIMFCQAVGTITTQKYAVLLTTFAKDVSLYVCQPKIWPNSKSVYFTKSDNSNEPTNKLASKHQQNTVKQQQPKEREKNPDVTKRHKKNNDECAPGTVAG